MKPINVCDIESMQAKLERLKAFLGLLADEMPGMDGREMAIHLETAFDMACSLHEQATATVNEAFEQ